MKITEKEFDKLNQLDRLEWLLLSNKFNTLDLYNFIFVCSLMIVYLLNINLLLNFISFIIIVIIGVKSIKKNILFKEWISNKFFQVQPKQKRKKWRQE